MITIDNMGTCQDDYLKKCEPCWLNEKSLKFILEDIYPGSEILYNKSLKLPGLKSKPDYIIPDKKVIVEYQGYHHFVKFEVTNRDNFKRNFHLFSGYTLIEIPYFIQLTTEVTKLLFNVEKDYSNGFPHGFLHPSLSLPGSFCKIGYERYKNILQKFGKNVENDILKSLQNRAKMLNCDIYVIS